MVVTQVLQLHLLQYQLQVVVMEDQIVVFLEVLEEEIVVAQARVVEVAVDEERCVIVHVHADHRHACATLAVSPRDRGSARWGWWVAGRQALAVREQSRAPGGAGC